MIIIKSLAYIHIYFCFFNSYPLVKILANNIYLGSDLLNNKNQPHVPHLSYWVHDLTKALY